MDTEEYRSVFTDVKLSQIAKRRGVGKLIMAVSISVLVLAVLLLVVVLIYLLSMTLIPNKTQCQQQQWIMHGSGIHLVQDKDCNLVDQSSV